MLRGGGTISLCDRPSRLLTYIDDTRRRVSAYERLTQTRLLNP